MTTVFLRLTGTVFTWQSGLASLGSKRAAGRGVAGRNVESIILIVKDK